jgi:CDP-diglyceride synthetase
VLNRILTAAILIPLVVWAILRLPTAAFAAATGVFLALAVWEWAGLIPLRTRAAKILIWSCSRPWPLAPGFCCNAILKSWLRCCHWP